MFFSFRAHIVSDDICKMDENYLKNCMIESYTSKAQCRSKVIYTISKCVRHLGFNTDATYYVCTLLI